MGPFGTGILHSDDALDIHGEYIDLRVRPNQFSLPSALVIALSRKVTVGTVEPSACSLILASRRCLA